MQKYPSEVKDIRYGKCLVATKDLQPGIIVQKFEGPIIKYKDAPLNEITYVIDASTNYNEDKWIIPKTDARYANHSCNPNCTIDDDLNIITTKPVKKGEELTYSYNIIQEEASKFVWDKRWTFKCECKSKNCQKVIDGYKNL
ncbi:MAG: SET domain-containing protein-lysine N-methyltransferase [Candidatus Nanoarchaeia archaeon]|nr:SET domain-containing protein-lysine N-methyltransferase [Candidatus Nanoarchaeia archaeon]